MFAASTDDLNGKGHHTFTRTWAVQTQGSFVIGRESRVYLKVGGHLPEATSYTHGALGYRRTHDTCLKSIPSVSPQAPASRRGATPTWKPCPLPCLPSLSTRPSPVHLDTCIALLRIQS